MVVSAIVVAVLLVVAIGHWAWSGTWFGWVIAGQLTNVLADVLGFIAEAFKQD
jgi:hypothetical protein